MTSVPEPFLVAAAGLYGLLFGSFANVCIYRLPRDKSVVFPASACPRCGRPIRWFDNLPVVSWLILLGRCRGCRNPISPRYPLVESIVGAVFALAMARHPGNWLEAGAEAVFGWALVVLVFTDLDHRILPDQVTIGGCVAGLLFSIGRGQEGIVASLVGLAVGGGLLWGISALYRLLRKQEGMGGGDVKMLAMVGAFLGWTGVALVLVLGSLAGAIVGVGLALAGRPMRSTALPFGVFLGLAALVAIYAGPFLLEIYRLN